MMDLEKEFRLWFKENSYFYEHLKMHDSVLYNRFMPVFEVLKFLYETEFKNSKNVDEDIVKIFQVGLEYLHTQINTCKIYLEKTFDNDMHEFLEYDNIINFILYLEDLQYELHESGISVNKNKFDQIFQYLESIVMHKKEIPDNIEMYVDGKVHDLIGDEDYNFNSIIDIFVEIANTLGIDLYKEEDYVIGKDI